MTKGIPHDEVHPDTLAAIAAEVAAEKAEKESYNGWTNYGTWGVNLVLSNEEGTYNYVRELAAEAKAEAPESSQVQEEIWTEEQYARFTLAEKIKDYTEELCGLGGEEYGLPEPTLMASQVIGTGLAEVDWDEIASAWLEEE